MTLTSVQSLAVAGIVGLLSGTHTAIWGKPVLHSQMRQRRVYFIPAYVAISLSTVVSLTLAVAP
jgi:hypothetical protein